MAETETPPPEADKDKAASLENADGADNVNALEPSAESADGVIDATGSSNAAKRAPEPKKGLKQKLKRFNFYLVFFIFILVIAGGIVAVAYFQSKKAAVTSTLKTQTLTQDALQKVAASDATVGNSQQILNVQSSAVFAGKVLIRDSLEVAGNLAIGGTVSLSNITVSGTTQLGQAQVNKDLSVAGDIGIQGAATIAKSLQVNGNGTFSGPLSAPQITTSNFQLNSDLMLTHHIIIGGATPTLARGNALGNGGSASVSGSDTGGTVSVNVGSSAAAGCFATINFTSKYNTPPHVLLTPVGADGGVIDYYTTRTATSFSICDASTPPTGTSFGFDYFVVN